MVKISLYDFSNIRIVKWKNTHNILSTSKFSFLLNASKCTIILFTYLYMNINNSKHIKYVKFDINNGKIITLDVNPSTKAFRKICFVKKRYCLLCKYCIRLNNVLNISFLIYGHNEMHFSLFYFLFLTLAWHLACVTVLCILKLQ